MIFVSRLLTQNRADLLLDATARLARRFDALRLVIVGDGPERSNLEARAQHLGIGDRVTFTGAIFEQTKLAPWMLSSTVCCYPVNIGLSLLHAFAFGLPVVTSDNLLLHGPEIAAMEHGVNGLLYRAGDIEAMAEACASILADPDRRRVMAESAQQAVRDRYNLDNMVQGLLDALSIADGRRRVIASSASTVASPAAVE
jgi:glycosyltransferase involved in cell wall biosynthesis